MSPRKGLTSAGHVRWRAWLLAPRLDRKLADGVDPSSSPELSWRARQLTSPHRRERLATALERLVKSAEIPQRMRGSAVPLNRSEVRRASGLIHDLAAELRDDQQVSPAGVLLVDKLLRGPTSPVYLPALEGALEFELRRARTALLLR